MNANGILPTIQQNLNVQISSPNGTCPLVGTASLQVIGANASRRGLIFFNPGPNVATVVPANQVAVSGQGITILPQSSREFIGDGKLINYNSAWNAIFDTGASNPLQILELV